MISLSIEMWSSQSLTFRVCHNTKFSLLGPPHSFSHLLFGYADTASQPWKVKVKCTPVQALRLCTGRTAHRGSRGIALLFLDRGTRWGEGSTSRPGRSLPPGKTRYPLYRRLGGPQGRSGQVRKISSPPGFDPRTVQPVDSRYTDWATRPTFTAIVSDKILLCHGPFLFWNYKVDQKIKYPSFVNLSCPYILLLCGVVHEGQ